MASKEKIRRIAVVGAIILVLVLGRASAEPPSPKKPSKDVKCPVCGMFVYKYPDWVAQIVFKDGFVAFFDGAKDMFKYYFDLKSYNPDKSIKDIEAIFVTEWYGMQAVEASGAFFVIGSDVYGPMGKELIPLKSAPEAEEFLNDHKGKTVLTFTQISPDTIKDLD